MRSAYRCALVVTILFAASVMSRAADGVASSRPITTNSPVTTDELGGMLYRLGLRPTRDGERHHFQFRGIYDGREWELSMSAVLSQNGKSIWFVAWLDEWNVSENGIPSAALLRLLAQNDQLGKGKFFAYIPANGRFVLQRVVENDGLSEDQLREVLFDLGTCVAETYPHWSVANWNTRANRQTARR